MNRKILGIAGLMAVALASGTIGYLVPRHGGAAASSSGVPVNGGADERKVLYWYDPMVPSQHFDKPGKSPFMDMALVARYAGENAQASEVRVDPAMAQNLGIRVVAVERGALADATDVPATIELNDRSVAIVQSRSAGFVERVYARAPGDVIAAGAPLVDLLVPDWAGAQDEFLALLRIGDPSLTQPARERLRLLGMPQDMIAAVESGAKAQPIVTIKAPIGGLIKSLDVRAGMSVPAGATLARINGLETVWLDGAVPEARGGRIFVGQRVRASLAAYPGREFEGAVIAILPEDNADSRTLRVRVVLPNAGGRLKAGMFAQLHIKGTAGVPRLLVPAEAVIRSGTRNVVLLALDRGRYQPVEVRLGAESTDKVEVMDGLKEGQWIVSSGQFLIDSEAGFRGALARLEPTSAEDPVKPELYETIGTVESVQDGKVTLSHGPVPALGWGPMTMGFDVARPEMASSVKPGDRIGFGFRKSGEGYVIESMNKVAVRP